MRTSAGPLSRSTPQAAPSDAVLPRRRHAATTRLLLLGAARSRFTKHGYAATTVREIAEDCGVNVALINRYFGSKVGLFEACLIDAAAELDTSVASGATLVQVADTIAAQIAGPRSAERPNQLTLLLRTSGDEQAERIRLDTLRSYAERLASVAGQWPDAPSHDQLILGAQLALCATFGIAILRSSTTLEPLASVDGTDLTQPIQALLRALLTGGD